MVTRHLTIGPVGRGARLSYVALITVSLVAAVALAAGEWRRVFEGRAGVSSTASVVVVDRQAFQAAEAAASQQLDRVDNGDGTWSYRLPSGFDPAVRVRGNLLTWRYAGQARHSLEPRFGGTRYWTAQVETPVAAADQVFQMRRVDRLGRVWKVDAIDQAAWDRVSRPDPAEIAANARSQSIPPTRERDPEPLPGTVVPWLPMAWDHQSCVAGGGFFQPNEAHFWDGDGRTQIFSGHTTRQSTAVMVRNTTATGVFVCSGVMLRQKQVLTAAHCVSDNSNNPVPVSQVQVCRDDVAPNPCIAAADIDFSASYGGGSGSGGGTDFADDWAIIELSTTWVAAGFSSANLMSMSSASDTTLASLTRVHNLAFPGFVPECAAQAFPPTVLIHNEEFEPIAGITSKKLKLKIDGVPGHSGSPLYYCPTGDIDVCETGDAGFVIGVFAGWDSIGNRFVGPKVASFRSAALVFLND